MSETKSTGETAAPTGVLINPSTRSITRVEVPSWRSISPLLGCSLFTTIRVGEADLLYLDDEGLLHESKPLWEWTGYPQPLAGSGLLLGCDPLGESTSTSFTLAGTARLVRWRPDLELAGIETTEGLELHPLFGTVSVIRSQPRFRQKKENEG